MTKLKPEQSGLGESKLQCSCKIHYQEHFCWCDFFFLSRCHVFLQFSTFTHIFKLFLLRIVWFSTVADTSPASSVHSATDNWLHLFKLADLLCHKIRKQTFGNKKKIFYLLFVKVLMKLSFFLTGTRIGQASECFVYWKDPMTNDTWGLNFTSPIDAKQFRECCVSIIISNTDFIVLRLYVVQLV